MESGQTVIGVHEGKLKKLTVKETREVPIKVSSYASMTKEKVVVFDEIDGWIHPSEVYTEQEVNQLFENK